MDSHQKAYFNFILHWSSVNLTVRSKVKKSHGTALCSHWLNYLLYCSQLRLSEVLSPVQSWTVQPRILHQKFALRIETFSFKAFKLTPFTSATFTLQKHLHECKENISVNALRIYFHLFLTNIQLHYNGFSWLKVWILSNHLQRENKC